MQQLLRLKDTAGHVAASRTSGLQCSASQKLQPVTWMRPARLRRSAIKAQVHGSSNSSLTWEQDLSRLTAQSPEADFQDCSSEDHLVQLVQQLPGTADAYPGGAQALASRLFFKLFENPLSRLHVTALASGLQLLRDQGMDSLPEDLTQWFTTFRGPSQIKFQPIIGEALLSRGLLLPEQLDHYFRALFAQDVTYGESFEPAVRFAMHILQRCIVEQQCVPYGEMYWMVAALRRYGATAPPPEQETIRRLTRQAREVWEAKQAEQDQERQQQQEEPSSSSSSSSAAAAVADTPQARTARLSRTTKETSIDINMNLDGNGFCSIDTPVPALNQLIQGVVDTSLMDLDLSATGDIWIDDHHCTEDVAIALGKVLAKAVGDRKGISRFGNATLPVDDALVTCTLDLSGRPHLCFELDIQTPKFGNFDTEMVEHFFMSIATYGGITLHVKKLGGSDERNVVTAAARAFGLALRRAIEVDPRRGGKIASSKGMLE